jgi:hypothetical protein
VHCKFRHDAVRVGSQGRVAAAPVPVNNWVAGCTSYRTVVGRSLGP